MTLITHLLQLKGNWNEGQLQKGQWKMQNGDFYEGEFMHNKPKGHGFWQMNNGNVISGSYSQEVLPNKEELDVEEKVDNVIKLKQSWQSNGEIQYAKK